MKNNFKIAKFKQEEDGSFSKLGYDEYVITYLKGLKVHELRIVVNGYLTKQKINLTHGRSGYKNIILLAIKEFIYKEKTNYDIVSKHISLSYIKNVYSKSIVRNVEKILLAVNKEESRDKLTEIGIVKV